MGEGSGEIKRTPAAVRNRFHALCPYFAMFPETFAQKWIRRLTEPGDAVLDPFSGRGTTAFQALLMHRYAIASDTNDVAFCLTKAKTNAPKLSKLLDRIDELRTGFDGRCWRYAATRSDKFFEKAFHARTLQQLLYLRSTLRWKTNAIDTMVAALVLGSLHGEADKSSSYLSNQMPRTISTKPQYSIRFWKENRLRAPKRDVFSVLEQRAEYRYETEPPDGNAVVLQTDMRQLPHLRNRLPKRISCVITSPPYFDVTNFEEDQWLRLWFLGGPPYPRCRRSSDDRHTTASGYWNFVADMWRSLGVILAKDAHVVVRIGTKRMTPERLEQALTAANVFSGRKVDRVSWRVSEIKNRQTDTFRPGSKGISVEIDCHYQFRN